MIVVNEFDKSRGLSKKYIIFTVRNVYGVTSVGRRWYDPSLTLKFSLYYQGEKSWLSS